MLLAQGFLGSYGWTIVTYDWLGGCLEYHRPSITNACPEIPEITAPKACTHSP